MSVNIEIDKHNIVQCQLVNSLYTENYKIIVIQNFTVVASAVFVTFAKHTHQYTQQKKLFS